MDVYKDLVFKAQDCLAVFGASNPSTAAPIPPCAEASGLLGGSGEHEYADTVALQVPEGCGLQETAQAIAAHYWDTDGDIQSQIQDDGSFQAPGDYRLLEMDGFTEISFMEFRLTEKTVGATQSQGELMVMVSNLRREPWFLPPGQTEPQLSVVHGLDLSSPEQVSALLLAVQEHMSQHPLDFKEKVAAQVQAKSLEKTTNKSRTGSER